MTLFAGTNGYAVAVSNQAKGSRSDVKQHGRAFLRCQGCINEPLLRFTNG